MEIQFQGRLVKASSYCAASVENTVVPRGNVTRFSRKSRKRLIEYCNRLDAKFKGRTVFITLTYPYLQTDHQAAKRHLSNMLKRLQRWGATTIIWRMEYQDNGSIHFHLICFGLPWLPFDDLKMMWRGGIDYPDSALFVRIQRITSMRMLLGYVSKYIAKLPTLLDIEPYPAVFIGRFWGIVGRKYAPLADLYRFVVHNIVDFWSFRRYVRRYYSIKTGKARAPTGFTLFTSDAYRWLDLYLSTCSQNVCSAYAKLNRA